MADFNITVDTHPLAASMESVRGQVQNVTGAVVAMQSAVVQAEKTAADQICRNVDNGFFILMKSQLSQKIAECSSVMSSKLMLMQKFSLDIQHIQEVMQEDYNRICRRYLKQFNSLDRSLEARIRELDKDAMDIGDTLKNLAARHKDDAAAAVLFSEETQLTSQKASEARVKVKAARAINAMKNDILGTKNYTENVDHILKEEKTEENQMQYVPVIVSESDSMFDGSTSIKNIYAPQSDGSGYGSGFSNAMTQAIQVSSESFNWEKMDQSESEKIRSSFVKLCGEANLEDRVSKEIMRLFNESEAVTLSAQGEGL